MPFFTERAKANAWAGFGQFIIAGSRECIKLPENISNADAALIEPMAVGLHLIERGQLSTGDTLVIWAPALLDWPSRNGLRRTA